MKRLLMMTGTAATLLAPMSAAISKVVALVEEYKLVAAQAKHCKGETPDPEPEPNGDAPVS